MAEIIRDQNAYIKKAVKFLAQDVQSPSENGPAPCHIENSDACDVAFIFRLDQEWTMHFPQAHAGTSGGIDDMGRLVHFSGTTPVCVERVDEAEAWFDSESGEWVEL